MLTGTSGKLALKQEISDGMPFGNLLEDLFEAFERSEFSDGATKNLLSRQAQGFALTIVDAQIAKFDRIEEGETNWRCLVDVFELGALTLSFILTTLEGLGEGFS